MASEIGFDFNDFMAYLKGQLDAFGVVIGNTDDKLFRQHLAFHVYRPLREIIKAYTEPEYIDISFLFKTEVKKSWINVKY